MLSSTAKKKQRAASSIYFLYFASCVIRTVRADCEVRRERQRGGDGGRGEKREGSAVYLVPPCVYLSLPHIPPRDLLFVCFFFSFLSIQRRFFCVVFCVVFNKALYLFLFYSTVFLLQIYFLIFCRVSIGLSEKCDLACRVSVWPTWVSQPVTACRRRRLRRLHRRRLHRRRRLIRLHPLGSKRASSGLLEASTSKARALTTRVGWKSATCSRSSGWY